MNEQAARSVGHRSGKQCEDEEIRRTGVQKQEQSKKWVFTRKVQGAAKDRKTER